MKLNNCVNLLGSRVTSQSDLQAGKKVLSSRNTSNLSSHVSSSPPKVSRFDSRVNLSSSNGDSDCADASGVPPAVCQSVVVMIPVPKLTCSCSRLMGRHYYTLLVPLTILRGIAFGLPLFIMVAVITLYPVALLGGSIRVCLIRNYNILFLDHIVLNGLLCLVLLCCSVMAWYVRAAILEDFLTVGCPCGLTTNMMFFYRRQFAVTIHFVIVIVLPQ